MAERLSIQERYAQLEQRGQQLAATTLPPSPVHAQTVAVLRKLLTMGTKFSSDKVPVPLRAMMRTLEHLEPVLVEELASVPPEAIAEFLGELIAEMQTIVDAAKGDNDGNRDAVGAGAGDAGAALAPTA